MEIVRKESKKGTSKVVAEVDAANQVVNQERIDKSQRDFDTFNAVLNEKKYGVKVSADSAVYLLDDFLNKIAWSGYESYAIKEIYEAVNGIRSESDKKGNFSIEGDLKPEVIEAIFYFVKKYEGHGWKEAIVFKGVADAFAIPMQEINGDRQVLRDLSLELIAAEQGVEVEKIREQYSAQPQM